MSKKTFKEPTFKDTILKLSYMFDFFIVPDDKTKTIKLVKK